MPKPSRSFLDIICALVVAMFMCLLACVQASAQAQTKPIYKDPSAPLEARVSDLFSQLTQDEKLSLFSTQGYVGECLPWAAIPRLGIPSLSSANAPQGIGGGKSTNFPMEVNMSSTWDLPLIRQDAAALGEEARSMGRQLIYAPCINIQQTPQGGRFFENFSEDPFVNSQFATAYITGMQSKGVACCVKHYFANNHENDRQGYSANMDERTMREIYLPGFRAAVVDAHAWSLMTAYNRVNDVYVCESKPDVTGILDTEWGWDGMAIGDWGSFHDTALSIDAGLDQEMPNPKIFSPASLSKALAVGSITQASIDDATKRLLRVIIRTGLADDPPAVVPYAVNTPEHRALALKTAEESIILLKNDKGILPLDRLKIRSVAVIGPNAKDTQLGGRWSADMHPFYMVSVLDGITAAAGPTTAVSYAQGCNRYGDTPDSMIADAVSLASKSDVAVVVVGTDQNYLGEGLDPKSLYLTGAQDKLIAAVSTANKNTVVVLNNGMPVLMNHWLSSVRGLIEAWYPGQESGNAVAEILFGDVDPSGHLTCTIASRREDYSDWPNYPGIKGEVNYAEGIYVGYRHFDKAKITPLYPFGYGLSYTSFTMDGLKIPRSINRGVGAVASVKVTNTGARAGDEIVQLYVRCLHPSIDRPVRELKGFERVSLTPGEIKPVTIPIGPDAFSYWDVNTHAWKADPGAYAIDVGDSSRNILASGKIELR